MVQCPALSRCVYYGFFTQSDWSQRYHTYILRYTFFGCSLSLVGIVKSKRMVDDLAAPNEAILSHSDKSSNRAAWIRVGHR